MDLHIGYIMTVSNSIIGVSILAMPFCFKQCGIILAIVMLLASSIISRLTCHYLLKSATMARRRTFELLAFHVFGTMGKLMVELGIIGFLMGTCIAFFVIIGDLGPAIIAKILDMQQTDSLRTTLLVCVAAFCILPLGLLKNVESLGSVSTATIGFYFCLVLKTIAESGGHFASGDWVSKVDLWKPSGILQCLPIFAMALSCQTQLFEIYETLPNASLDKMNYVVRAAVNICVCVYICVGFFGYVAFTTRSFTGNILMSFSPSMMTDIMKIGFVLSVACSFPLVIFPCRASLYSLLFKKGYTPYEGIKSHIPETRFKLLTLLIVGVSLIIGIMIPNIEVVLGLLGSTIGTMICVIFPVTCFICISTKNTNERLLAQIMLFVGVLMMVLGTYANLYAMEEINTTPIHQERDPFPIKSSIDLDEIYKSLRNKYETALEKVKEKEAEEKKAFTVKPEGEVHQELPQPVAPQENKKSAEPAKEPEKKEEPKAPEKKEVKESEKKEEPKEPPKPEEVDKAAIEKEDKELQEEEKDKKDDKKDEDLLATLQKHKEEQQNLIKKQQKLLEEIKKETNELKNKKYDNIEKQNEVRIKAANKIVEIAKQALEGLGPQNNENELNKEVKTLENAQKAIENEVKKEVKIPLSLPLVMSSSEPIKEEPKKEEPKPEEPKKENPKVEEPKKEEPKVEPKKEEPKKEEPKSEEPKKEEPKKEEPKKEETKKEEPKVEESKKEEPKPEDPKKEEPKKEEPKKEEPKKEEPKKEEPKKEEPKKEEPKKEEPKKEEPIKEEPKKEELKKEEPKKEEPKKDEPKKDESKPEEPKKEENKVGRDILAASEEKHRRKREIEETDNKNCIKSDDVSLPPTNKLLELAGKQESILKYEDSILSNIELSQAMLKTNLLNLSKRRK